MGALLTYALNKDNRLVHVDEVKTGAACECHCPRCNSPLDAKNGGTIREHHFAHAHGHTCEGAYESTLHLLAKQVVEEQGGCLTQILEICQLGLSSLVILKLRNGIILSIYVLTQKEY